MVLSRAKADVAVPVGSYDPLLGYSYTEIGGMARSQHHSQAMGSPQPVGAAEVYLKNVAGEPARDDLMEGVTSGWPEPIRNTLTSMAKAFSPSKPYESVPALLQARVAISALKTDLAARKLRDLDELDSEVLRPQSHSVWSINRSQPRRRTFELRRSTGHRSP